MKEDIENKPFIDILNRLDKLELIPDIEAWMALRNIINSLAHEYENDSEEISRIINNIYDRRELLKSFFYTGNPFFPFLSAVITENLGTNAIIICKDKKSTLNFYENLSSFYKISESKRKIFLGKSKGKIHKNIQQSLINFSVAIFTASSLLYFGIHLSFFNFDISNIIFGTSPAHPCFPPA